MICGVVLPTRTDAEVIGLEILEWDQELTGTLQISGNSLPGTKADLQDDLGLEAQDYLTQERLWFHWGKGNYLLASHLESNRSGTELLTSQLVFGGVTFAPGETINSRLELRQDSLLYRYDFLNLPMFKLGVPFGAMRLHMTTKVESTTTGFVGEGSDIGTVPVAGLAFSFQPIPIIHISGEIEGMNLHYQGNDYRLYDARGQVEINFAPFIGLNLGYRRGDADVEMEDLGKTDLTAKGPFATLTFRF